MSLFAVLHASSVLIVTADREASAKITVVQILQCSLELSVLCVLCMKWRFCGPCARLSSCFIPVTTELISMKCDTGDLHQTFAGEFNFGLYRPSTIDLFL
jgi:hypothetical protein